MTNIFIEIHNILYHILTTPVYENGRVFSLFYAMVLLDSSSL